MEPSGQHYHLTAAKSEIEEIKRKIYTFWRQFNEKPSIMPGCPGIKVETSHPFHKQHGTGMPHSICLQPRSGGALQIQACLAAV